MNAIRAIHALGALLCLGSSLLGSPLLGAQTPAGASTAATIAPAKTPVLATRDRYRLQPGDRFDVVFRYTPELNQTVSVEPDGFINLGATGELKVSDLTLTQATDLIQQNCAGHLRDPQVNLTLKDFHKPFFVVAGEVKHPGRFDMDEATTAWQALQLAGGMEPTARESQVVVFRRLNSQQAEVRVLNFHRMTSGKDLEHDLMLQPGDMLLVQRDRLAKFDRFVKTANLGLYFNPLDLGL